MAAFFAPTCRGGFYEASGMRPANHRLHGDIRPKFRGMGVGSAAIDRTIDIFGPACGLVACKPWPLQFTPAFARDGKALKRLKAPGVGQDEAVRNLRAYWSKLGFWPVGETGIYLLGMAQRSCLTCRKSDDRRCLQPYKHLRRIYCAGISPL